jgi:hypothetical protein
MTSPTPGKSPTRLIIFSRAANPREAPGQRSGRVFRRAVLIPPGPRIPRNPVSGPSEGPLSGFDFPARKPSDVSKANAGRDFPQNADPGPRRFETPGYRPFPFFRDFPFPGPPAGKIRSRPPRPRVRKTPETKKGMEDHTFSAPFFRPRGSKRTRKRGIRGRGRGVFRPAPEIRTRGRRGFHSIFPGGPEISRNARERSSETNPKTARTKKNPVKFKTPGSSFIVRHPNERRRIDLRMTFFSRQKKVSRCRASSS